MADFSVFGEDKETHADYSAIDVESDCYFCSGRATGMYSVKNKKLLFICTVDPTHLHEVDFAFE